MFPLLKLPFPQTTTTALNDHTMNPRSQIITGALKMLGIFALLALFTPIFAQDAAGAVAVMVGLGFDFSSGGLGTCFNLIFFIPS